MSQGPWSVKGPDERARPAARDRAATDGRTLDEHIGDMLSDEGGSPEPREETTPKRRRTEGADRTAEIRRLARRIDDIASKVEGVQTQSSRALAGVDRSIIGVVGRFETSGRQQASLLEHVARAIRRLEQAHGELKQEVRAVPASRVEDAERAMLELRGALLRLEDRLEQQAGEFARRQDEAAARLETGAAARAAVEEAARRELSARVDGLQREARGASVALGAGIEKLGERVARSEGKSGVAFDAVQTSLETLEQRIAEIDARSSAQGEEARDLLEAVKARVEGMAGEIARPIETVRADLERRIAQAIEQEGANQRIHTERALRQVQDRLTLAETGSQEALTTLRAQMDRMSRLADERIRALEERHDGRAASELRTEVLRLIDGLDARQSRLETETAASRRMAESLLAQLTDALDDVDKRLIASDRKSAAAIDAVGAQLTAAAERLQGRYDDLIRSLGEKVDAVARSVEARPPADAVASTLEQRIRDSEHRSAAAITQLGEQVARVADRLQTQQRDAVQGLESRLAESGRSQETRLAEALAEITRRIDEITEQATVSLSPIQTTVSSLAQRLAHMEDGRAPVDAAPHPEPGDAGGGDSLFLEDDEGEPVVGIEPPPFDRPPSGARPDAEGVVLPFDDMLEELAHPPQANPASGAPELIAILPDAPRRSPEDERFLEEARRAARQGRRIDLGGGRRGAMSRAPVVASAALALAVAGGAAWTVMRGKQEAGGDAMAKLDPFGAAESQSVAAAGGGSQAGAEAALFDAEDGAAPEEDPGEGLFAEADLPGSAGATGPAPSIEDAVAAGDPVAMYDTAVSLLPTTERARAIALLKEAAAKGLTMAQFRLAKVYENGEGVPRDLSAARSFTEAAAIGGNVKAMHDLAVYFSEGDVGPQSYAAAAQWFREAAELGLVDSQFNLAVLYEQGLGVSLDPVEAAFWFDVSGRAGDPDGVRRARALLSQLSPAEAETVARRARAFTPQRPDAAANGDFGPRPWDVLAPPQIMDIQRMLDRLGYLTIAPDGRMGARTAEAIRRFESDSGLPSTGEATLELMRHLRAATLGSGG